MADGLAHSRQEARTLGLATYFSGAPCPHGHITVRYAKSGDCRECARKKSRSYMTRRREREGDVFKQAQKDWTKTNTGWLSCALNDAKKRAKSKNLEFNISISDLSVPSHCPVLGVQLVIGNGFAQDNSPSIDRIHPALGYVRGNVRVISWKANRLKNDGDYIELMKVAMDLQKIASMRIHDRNC